jgi:hypothetical protein
MNYRQRNLYAFRKNFQENLCQLMLEDRPFFDQITEVLDVTFLKRNIFKFCTNTYQL